MVKLSINLFRNHSCEKGTQLKNGSLDDETNQSIYLGTTKANPE
jgi:hypothetical protein